MSWAAIPLLHLLTLPWLSKQLESALLGSTFDPYVRFIVMEGIRQWWRNASTNEWLECPPRGDPYPHNPSKGSSASARSWMTAGWVASIPAPVRNFVVGLATASGWLDEDQVVDIEGFDAQTAALAQLAQQPDFSAEADDDANFPACPYTWAKPLHTINCAYAWPQGWDPRSPVVELDTPEYLGKIGDDKVVEMLLAKAGIRLAAILNSIFLKDDVDVGRGPWFEE